MPPARLRLALSLVSAAALAYEILLTRLFSIIQWHHFAYMMISVALLGYGRLHPTQLQTDDVARPSPRGTVSSRVAL